MVDSPNTDVEGLMDIDGISEQATGNAVSTRPPFSEGKVEVESVASSTHPGSFRQESEPTASTLRKFRASLQKFAPFPRNEPSYAPSSAASASILSSATGRGSR